MTAARGRWVVVLSLLIAVLLSVVQVPEWARWARPEWVALVLIYWVIALPQRVGIGVAWVTGLLLDLVEGVTLGQNALALSVVAYVGLALYQRMRMYAAWQQAGIVFILVGLNQLICHWVQTVTLARVAPNLMFLLSALVSALLWPSILVLLRYCRRRFGVT